MTRTAAAVSQELSPFGLALGVTRTGTKYPVQGIPHFDFNGHESGNRRQRCDLKIRPHPEGGDRACLSDWNESFQDTHPAAGPFILLCFTMVSAHSRKCFKFSRCRCAPDNVTRCFTYIKPLVLNMKIDAFCKAPGHAPAPHFEASWHFWPQMASQQDPQNIKNLTRSAK